MPSNYFSRLSGVFRLGVHRSIFRQEGGLLDSLDVIDARAKSLIGNSRLFSCVTSSIDPGFLLQPGTVAVQPHLHLVNRREKISFVGTLSHTFSTSPVSGPAFQITGYHVHCLQSEASKFCSSIKTEKAPMPVFYSRVFPSNCSLSNLTSRCGGLREIVTYPSTSFSKRRFGGCKKTSMDLTTKASKKFSIYECLVYNVAKTKGNFNPSSWYGLKNFHTSSRASFSAGTAHDTSFDNPTHEKQLSSSADSSDSSEQKIPVEITLKLHSGSCYLPHPDKEETGGEDAHFICADEQAIGVADGVGGWADLGVDAGQYARELMSHSVTAVQEEPKGSIDPARVLEKAYLRTKAKGSSTACVIALTDLGLRAINLGDSGFMVVRDGSTVFRSPIQQHDFNFTYQLESGNSGDLPSSGQVFTIPVVSGDVVIAGTDGLFDNLYNNDITSVVVHAVRAGFGPQVTAQKIAALARQRAQDKNRQTPFSAAAQEAGFRYYGGKLDDITVVVSFITSYNDKHHSDKMLVG